MKLAETLEFACSRIEVLRIHGYETEAVRLALAVSRTIKEESKKWMTLERPRHKSNTEVQTINRESTDDNPLKSIMILHDTLSHHYDFEIEKRLLQQKGEELSFDSSLKQKLAVSVGFVHFIFYIRFLLFCGNSL